MATTSRPPRTTSASQDGRGGRRTTGTGSARFRPLTAAAVLGLLAGSLCGPTVARAAQVDDPPGGSTSPGGYTAQVRIRFTGEAAPNGGATLVMRVAPVCWWEPAAGPYTDAAASLEWYDQVTGGAPTREVISEYGPRRIWEEAAEAEANGSDLSWYRAFCIDPADYERYDAGASENVDPVLGNPETFVTYYYRPLDAGAPVPDPLVDPEELARAAREVMVIPVPETDRNPKIKSAGAPTLVGLPTWFWVAPAAVGGATGDRDITASLGAVSATVIAKTGGLHLNSPAGGQTCVPTRAVVKYGAGVAESSACTVEFTRASMAYANGYPVVASTNWEATWTGSDGSSGGLDPLAREFTDNVPVAEVQNIVTRG